MSYHRWFREYCEKATSQCMKYFVMKQRYFIEKTFWILAFLLMLFFTTTAMISLIYTWINSPTVLFVENTESSIQEIPFPAVTICPSNQLRKSVWKKFMNINSTRGEDIQHYRSLICSSHVYSYKMDFNTLEDLNYETFKNIVNNSVISCPELLQSTVTWQNTTTKNFCDLVQPILSKVGLCYSINVLPLNQILNDEHYQRYRQFFLNHITFNYTRRSKWNLDYGYFDDDLLDVYPLRSSGVSLYNRLRLTLYSLDDEFLACPNGGYKDGYFLVIISNPFGFPAIQSRSFILPDTYTKIQISPFVKKIDSDLKRRSTDVRKCYLHNERKLSLFVYYTESNCFEECIINKTLSLCKCVSFEWAYIMENEVKICSPAKIDCITKVIVSVYEPKSRMECNCLPTCNLIQYDITESSYYDDWTYFKTTKLEKNKGATVEIVFKLPYFTAYKAASILNISSLISVVGGICSLFLGLNILNIFEIVYIIMKMFICYIMHFLKNDDSIIHP